MRLCPAFLGDGVFTRARGKSAGSWRDPDL